MKCYLADGLYRVQTTYFVAGFVVESGRVTRCAPILRRQLGHWITRATRIGDANPALRAEKKKVARDDN